MERVIKLSFREPVHFGKGRLSDSEYTCDAGTLFSALFIESLQMGLAQDLLEAVYSEDFIISDAFPFIGDCLYIPKPMTSLKSDDRQQLTESDSRARKASKKLEYIPVESLSDYLEGRFDSVLEAERFDLGCSSLCTKVNLERKLTDDAEPYHIGGYFYNPECGIYFIQKGAYNFFPVLEQLSYSGLGGKRSSGYGSFEFEVIEPAEPFSSSCAKKHGYMLLSSAMPRENELTNSLLADARYRLTRKGGFVYSAEYSASPYRKKDIWTFSPGSIFTKKFSGDIFDISDVSGNHSVYRYARALWMEV